MPGKPAYLRRKEKYRQLFQEKQKRRESRLSTNLSPERAFYLIAKRVEWLNDKIAWAQANNLKYALYIEEREALLWAVDKIKELSEKLLGRNYT